MVDERSDLHDEPAGERERRVEAALALTSKPPTSLWERIQARRAAGERVILPVGELRPTPRRRGIPALALSLAAAAVVTVFAVQAWRASPDGGAKRVPGAMVPANVLYSTTVDGRGAIILDSALAVAIAGADRIVEIVHLPGSTPAVWAARRAADSIAAEFRGRGVPATAVIVREISESERSRAPLSPSELRITVFRDGIARGRD